LTLSELLESVGARSQDSLYSVVFVTNELTADASVVRGMVFHKVFSEEGAEPSAAFFGDIYADTKAYENLPEHRIDTSISPSTALRQHVRTLPNEITFVSTNVHGWVEPLVQSLNEHFDLFAGRCVDIVDLAQLVDVAHDKQIRRYVDWSKALPPNRRAGPKASLGALAYEQGISRRQYRSPIYAVVRAQMIADTAKAALGREIKVAQEQ